MISAKMGCEDALNYIKRMFMNELATKEIYKEALVGFRDAMEKQKSPDREEAKSSIIGLSSAPVKDKKAQDTHTQTQHPRRVNT